MRPYDAAVFDLDGTLLNTLEDLYLATNYALTTLGCPPRSLDQVRRFVGNGVAKLLERALPKGAETGQLEAALALFKPYYEQHRGDHTAPYGGIIPLLQALKAENIQISVVSNKFDHAVKALAADYFPGLVDVAMGENEAAGIPKKPHPAMVRSALKRLGVTPERAVYIGDSDVDIQTAKNAGMDCLSVTWGFRDRDHLLAHGATRLADRPEDLLYLIKGER